MPRGKLVAMTLPRQARIVIVGGGIVGCSTAYHLAKLGETDVLLLEQGELTCGTTWHAAGLVGQMRPNRNMTRMSKYGIELYALARGRDRPGHRLEAVRQRQRRRHAASG